MWSASVVLPHPHYMPAQWPSLHPLHHLSCSCPRTFALTTPLPKHPLLRHVSGWFFLNIELLSHIPPHQKAFHDFFFFSEIARVGFCYLQSEKSNGFKRQFSWEKNPKQKNHLALSFPSSTTSPSESVNVFVALFLDPVADLLLD